MRYNMMVAGRMFHVKRNGIDQLPGTVLAYTITVPNKPSIYAAGRSRFCLNYAQNKFRRRPLNVKLELAARAYQSRRKPA